jgi:hypothetical protein
MVAHRGALRGDGDDVEERKNLRRFPLRWRRLAGELGSDYTDRSDEDVDPDGGAMHAGCKATEGCLGLACLTE